MGVAGAFSTIKVNFRMNPLAHRGSWCGSPRGHSRCRRPPGPPSVRPFTHRGNWSDLRCSLAARTCDDGWCRSAAGPEKSSSSSCSRWRDKEVAGGKAAAPPARDRHRDARKLRLTPQRRANAATPNTTINPLGNATIHTSGRRGWVGHQAEQEGNNKTGRTKGTAERDVGNCNNLPVWSGVCLTSATQRQGRTGCCRGAPPRRCPATTWKAHCPSSYRPFGRSASRL